MSTPGFNKAANGGYTNHVAVMCDINRISTKLLEMPQLDLQALMLEDDEDKVIESLASYAANVQSFGKKFVSDLDVISSKLAQSQALGSTLQEAFAQQLGAVKSQLAVNSKSIQVTLDAINGIEPSMQQQVQLQVETQQAQMDVIQAQRNLFEVIYGFKTGQTLADVNTAANMTIKDFERCNAMLAYSADLGTLMKDIGPALQNSDMLALGRIVDLADDSTKKTAAIISAVSGTLNMTPVEKEVCKEAAAAGSDMLAAVSNGLGGLMMGNTEAIMDMMQGMQRLAKQTIQAQTKYYAVLEKAYAKDASAPAPKAGKGGPKNG